MGKVIAICIAEKRGIAKQSVSSGYFREGWGLEGDAHADKWHRQVSLLSADKIEAFNSQGAGVASGDFGENLVVAGINLRALPIGALLRCGDVILEISQKGKECHTRCDIFARMGDCIMPREGVFARVLHSGVINAGDEITVESDGVWRAAVITLSDKGAQGERKDESGPAIAARLRETGYDVVDEILLPDDSKSLKNKLIRLCDECSLDLILTTGGTGFSPRDITPEATLSVAERRVPGISEAMRAKSMSVTPRAMLSRAESVIRGKTLIINLPGSPKACMECMDVFMDIIPHALELLRGDTSDCANGKKNNSLKVSN